MFLIFITIAFLRHVTARQAKRRSIFTDMSKLFRAMSEEVTASYYTIGIISDKNIVIKILHKIAKLME